MLSPSAILDQLNILNNRAADFHGDGECGDQRKRQRQRLQLGQ